LFIFHSAGRLHGGGKGWHAADSFADRWNHDSGHVVSNFIHVLHRSNSMDRDTSDALVHAKLSRSAKLLLLSNPCTSTFIFPL
jgi:hypothetical protein